MEKQNKSMFVFIHTIRNGVHEAHADMKDIRNWLMYFIFLRSAQEQ